MTTQRCRVCDEKGAPVEGMTGQCRFCGEIFCLGHLTWSSHNCQPKFHLDEFQKEEKGSRCGDYAEYWEELGKPKGWLGCSLPKGHEGNHRDEREE